MLHSIAVVYGWCPSQIVPLLEHNLPQPDYFPCRYGSAGEQYTGSSWDCRATLQSSEEEIVIVSVVNGLSVIY